jgi:hypothetical protein
MLEHRPENCTGDLRKTIFKGVNTIETADDETIVLLAFSLAVLAPRSVPFFVRFFERISLSGYLRFNESHGTGGKKWKWLRNALPEQFAEGLQYDVCRRDMTESSDRVPSYQYGAWLLACASGA